MNLLMQTTIESVYLVFFNNYLYHLKTLLIVSEKKLFNILRICLFFDGKNFIKSSSKSNGILKTVNLKNSAMKRQQ